MGCYVDWVLANPDWARFILHSRGRVEASELGGQLRDANRLHHGRIEEALRASEERYRLLIEHAPIGILSTNRAGSLLSANTAALQMLLDPTMLDQDEINLFFG